MLPQLSFPGWFGTVVLLITLLVSGTHIPTLSTSAQDSTRTATFDPIEQIPDLLAGSDSVFGVLIIDADDQVLFEQNADVPFVSASLYKLVLLAETLARIDEGSLQLDQLVTIEQKFYLIANGEDSYFSADAVGFEATIEELVYATGAYSSNVGAQALMSLTSVEQLERFAADLGLGDTRYWVKLDEVSSVYAQVSGQAPALDYVRSIAFIESFVGYGQINLTTPRDMATFFTLLRDDLLISSVVSWQLKNLLDARLINDRIPSLLPEGVPVIHKTGNLAGVLHDVGFIETPSGPMITIAMAQAVTDIEGTRSIEQRIGLLAYQLGGPSDRPEPAEGTPTAATRVW